MNMLAKKCLLWCVMSYSVFWNECSWSQERLYTAVTSTQSTTNVNEEADDDEDDLLSDYEP